MTITVGNIFGNDVSNRFKYNPNNSLLLPDVCIGVEVEVEDSNISDISGYQCNSNIKCVPDNSLRESGAEFIFVNPVFGEDLLDSLEALKTSIPEDSTHGFRTSTHIHLDVRDLEVEEVIKMVVIYSLIEPLFYTFNNEDRWDNPFSYPLTTSLYNPEYMRNIKELMSSPRLNTPLAVSASERYFALNLSSISKFGSLEFRMFNSTRDPEEILKFIKVVMLTRLLKGMVGDDLEVDIRAIESKLSSLGYAYRINADCYEALMKIRSSSIAEREYYNSEPRGSIGLETTESGEDFNVG